jgi:hypothetical protein
MNGNKLKPPKDVKYVHTRQVDHQNIDITSNNTLPLEESASPAAPETRFLNPHPYLYMVLQTTTKW